MTPPLLELAESPGAYVLPPHPWVVEGDGYITLPRVTGVLTVQRVRLAPARLEDARAEVRELARARDVQRVEWCVSALSEPADLAERLALERQETLAGLALTSPPPPPGGFEVREIETLEDYVRAQTIDAIANEMPVLTNERYAEMWEVARERFLVWLALDDGEPIGTARCAVSAYALLMIGGSVLPDARGRGVYRTLIAARWQTAVERGVPALVTAANTQSAPILRRLGFEELGAIDVYAETL